MVDFEFLKKRRAQTGTEYLIIVGFVTLAVMAIVAIAFFMTNSTKDRLVMDQVTTFTKTTISSAESIFFAGEPSKATVDLFLPAEVKNITIYEYEILVEVELSSGKDVESYRSRVPLNGTIIARSGTKRLLFLATENYVNITEI